MFVVTFTGAIGADMTTADTANVEVDFTFDTENMLWACTKSSETTTVQVIARKT